MNNGYEQIQIIEQTRDILVPRFKQASLCVIKELFKDF